jgi:hypothetical protein
MKHRPAGGNKLHQIFEIIEKQTLKKYARSLGIFGDPLIFSISSMFCLRNYYKLETPPSFLEGKYRKGNIEGEFFFLKNCEGVILDEKVSD